MSKHAAKVRIYEQFARIGKALAAPARLELLDLLLQGERSVDALARETQMSVANASQHLQVLLAARLVDTRRDAQRIYYRIAASEVLDLWLAVRRTAEAQLAEMPGVAREYLGDPDAFQPIDREDLARRLDAGTVVLIDVRPVEEFEQGHIAGAVSVPITEIKSWARDHAPKRKQIVAYCRGPYCVYARQAVAELRKQGRRAMRLGDGVAEWRIAGYQVTTGGAA
ncbi:MAG TPA: metalloregulator ArsR/SmtB family transcription factor [Kofleriaceae bacterium]|jgi:rhodanese-related sulfurtransferase